MKVSIVIPTYKRVSYLDRLLKSIAKQTFNEFEVIVVDDNSPNRDSYNELINKYLSIFNDFTFLRNEKNEGAPFSRNKGIKEAKYDYIALVDDDDEWLPNKLEKQVEIFENSSDKLGIVYTWAKTVDQKGKVLHKYKNNIEGNPKSDILRGCFIPSPSVMVKKEHILKAGLFDEKLPSCQDWDMWTRMILMGSECKVVKSIETLYYKHDSGSIGLSDKAYKGFLMFFRKHFFSALKVNPLISFYYIFKYINIILKKEV